MTDRKWYAVAVRGQMEQQVGYSLKSKGIEVSVPCSRVRRRWSDRNKVVEVPLFPGYVFCALDLQNRTPVLSTPGVLNLVSCEGRALALEPHEVNMILRLTHHDVVAQPSPLLHNGQFVRIVDGPLSGAEGILVDAETTPRVILSIGKLSRGVSIKVELRQVTPLRKHAAAASAVAAAHAG